MMNGVSRIGLLCATLVSVGLSAPAFAETKVMTTKDCDKVQIQLDQQATCESCDWGGHWSLNDQPFN